MENIQEIWSKIYTIRAARSIFQAFREGDILEGFNLFHDPDGPMTGSNRPILCQIWHFGTNMAKEVENIQDT